MKIRDIMNKDIEVVSPETLLHDVAKKMLQRDCGSILVAKDDRLVGVITDRDLALRCVAQGHHPVETTAEKVMTPEILYCRDTDEVEAVALNMTQNKVRRLPVLDENKRLVGIVSLGDLAINSTDHVVCGRALGHICAAKGDILKPESDQKCSNNQSGKSGLALLLVLAMVAGWARSEIPKSITSNSSASFASAIAVEETQRIQTVVQTITKGRETIDVNDGERMARNFEEDPDALAAKLNMIEPGN